MAKSAYQQFYGEITVNGSKRMCNVFVSEKEIRIKADLELPISLPIQVTSDSKMFCEFDSNGVPTKMGMLK